MPKVIANKKVELWTESFGSEDRECILLIAGAQAPSTFWPDLFCKELARLSYFVIRYDHRDIGYSTHFPVAKSDAVKHSGDVHAGPYDVFALVDDALAILDGYGVKKAHVVGHSMGGFIAELLILRHADRMHSATIMSAGSPPIMHERHKLLAASQKTRDVLLSNKPTGDFAKDLPGWLNS
ncbi:MAG: alpha/beta fold hydrolase, partial [Gammaproteobacteria bacterium]|nr:alpha/beta fold hydrolase [Gammaproteobacteria bacterium]